MKAITWTLLVSGTAAWAHEGHGLAGASHWHAADGPGWLLAAAVAAGALWWARSR